MRRITKAALGGLAGCVLVLGGTEAASGEEPVETQTFSGALTDLDTDDTNLYITTGAFDSATASLKVTEDSEGTTTFWLRVKGIDLAAGGPEFGAHLHTGLCLENQPATAVTGPHFRLPETPPLRETEVWFDLVPNEDGVAVDKTNVSFVPVDQPVGLLPIDGIMSIVIHANPNPSDGAAGNKEACLPLQVPSWI